MGLSSSPFDRNPMPAFIQQDHLRFPQDCEEPSHIRVFKESPLNGFTVKRCSYMSLVYKSMYPNLESSPWESDDFEGPYATTLPGRYVINSVSASSQNTPSHESSFIKIKRSHSSSSSMRGGIPKVASTNPYAIQEMDKNFHVQNLSFNASQADANGKPARQKVERTSGRFFRSASLSSTTSPRIHYNPEPRAPAPRKHVALQAQGKLKPFGVEENHNLFGQPSADSFSLHGGRKSSIYGSDEDFKEWSSSKERRSRARERDKPPYGECKPKPTSARGKGANQKTASVPAASSQALVPVFYSNPDTRSSSFLRRFAGLVARLVLSEKLEGSVIDPQGLKPQIAQYRVPCSLRWHPETRDVFGKCETDENAADKTSTVDGVSNSAVGVNRGNLDLSDNDKGGGDLEESKDSHTDRLCSESATLEVAVPLDTNSNKDYPESSEMDISECTKVPYKFEGDYGDVLENHKGDVKGSASIQQGGESEVVEEAVSSEDKDISTQSSGSSSNKLTHIKGEDSCQDHVEASTIERGLEDDERSDDSSTSDIDFSLPHRQLIDADILESEYSSMELEENFNKTENNERGRTPAHEQSNMDRLDIGDFEEDSTSCTGSVLTQWTHQEVEPIKSTATIQSVQSLRPATATLFVEANESSKRDENSYLVNNVDYISEGEESGSSSEEDEDSQVEMVHESIPKLKTSPRVSHTENEGDESQSITDDTTEGSSSQAEGEGKHKRGVVRVRSVRDKLYRLGDIRRKGTREAMTGRNYRICKQDHMENFYWNSITWRIRENWPQSVNHRRVSTSSASNSSSKRSPTSVWREKNKLSPSPRGEKVIPEAKRLSSVSSDNGSDKMKSTKIRSKKDDKSDLQRNVLESEESFKKETHPLTTPKVDHLATRQSAPQVVDKISPGKDRGEDKLRYPDVWLSPPASTHQSNDKEEADFCISDKADQKDDSIESSCFSPADEMIKTPVSPNAVAVVKSGIVGSILFDDMLDENLDQISAEHLLRSRTERHTRPRLSEQPQRVESANSPTYIPADTTTLPSPERKEEKYTPLLAMFDEEPAQGTVVKVEDGNYQKEDSPCRICPPETEEERSDDTAEKHHTEKLDETESEPPKEFIDKLKTRFWSQSIRNWSWPFLRKHNSTQKATDGEKMGEKGEPQLREYFLKQTEVTDSRDDDDKGTGDSHSKGSKPCLICPIEEESYEELGDVGDIEIEIDFNEELHDVEIHAPCSICPPDKEAHNNQQEEVPAPEFKPCLVCPEDDEDFAKKPTKDVTKGRRGYLPKSEGPSTNDEQAIKTSGKSSHRRVVKELSLNYDRDHIIFVEEVLAKTPPEQRVEELPSYLAKPETERVEEPDQKQNLVLPLEENDKSLVEPQKKSPNRVEFKSKDLTIPRYKVVSKIARNSDSSTDPNSGKADNDKDEARLVGSTSEAADTMVFLERSAHAAAIFTDVINDYKSSYLDAGSVFQANNEHTSTLSYIRQKILDELERFSARNVKTNFDVPDRSGLIEPPAAKPIYLSRQTIEKMEKYLNIDLTSWFYPYTVCTESSSKDSVRPPTEAAGDQNSTVARTEIKSPSSPKAEIKQDPTESEQKPQNFVENDRELTFYRPVVPMNTFTDAKCRCRHCRKNLLNKQKRDARDDDPNCTAAEVGEGGSEVCRRLARGSDQKQVCGGAAVLRRHQHGTDMMDPWAHSELDRQSVIKTNRRIYADRFYRKKLTVRNILSLCSERTPGLASSKNTDSWKEDQTTSDGKAIDVTRDLREIKDIAKFSKWPCGDDKGEMSGKTTDALRVCTVGCDEIMPASKCQRVPSVTPCFLGSRVKEYHQSPIDKMVFVQQCRELEPPNIQSADCDAAKKTEQRLIGTDCVWSASNDATTKIPHRGNYVGQTRPIQECVGQKRHEREYVDPSAAHAGIAAYPHLTAHKKSPYSPNAKSLSLETCRNSLCQPAVEPYSTSFFCQKPSLNYSSFGCSSLGRSLHSGSSFCDFLSQMYRECSRISRVSSYAKSPVQPYEVPCRITNSSPLVPSYSTNTLTSCVYRPADSSRLCSKALCPGCYVTKPRMDLASGKAPCFSVHQYV